MSEVEIATEGPRLLAALDLNLVLPLSEPVDLQRLHLRPALPRSARISNPFFHCRFLPQSVQHGPVGGAHSSASRAASGSPRISRMPLGHLIGCGVPTPPMPQPKMCLSPPRPRTCKPWALTA